jgi:hypothetical protein
MNEKKSFMIPRNFKAQYEILPGVNLKDLLFFIPSIIIDVPIVLWIPIGTGAKIAISVILFFIPFLAVFIKPVQPRDIRAWQLAKYKLQYISEQKTFYYRKEGLKNDEIIPEKAAKVISSRKRKNVSTTINTNQSY